MAGLDGKSPLGRIVSIRAENDPEILKQYSPEQRQIRDRWRRRKAKAMPLADRDAFIENIKNILVGMAGGIERCAVDEKIGDGETDMS